MVLELGEYVREGIVYNDIKTKFHDVQLVCISSKLYICHLMVVLY